MSYGWPVKPFARQHPVRGFFNDPRIDGASHAFHFGIDISAPDGTEVFSVAPGTVFIEDRGHAVAVKSGARVFAYWHVKPAVAHHQQVGLHQLLGRIEPGWAHVHFAESVNRRYLDPLRNGAIEPFVDVGHPTVSQIVLRHGAAEVKGEPIRGLIDICCTAFDTTPIAVPAPWSHMPVAPALVRFRIVRDGRALVGWRSGVDLRRFRTVDAFHLIYAPETRQNHPGKPGTYRYWLARDLDTRRLGNGACRIDVEAQDAHGNRARASRTVTVANPG